MENEEINALLFQLIRIADALEAREARQARLAQKTPVFTPTPEGGYLCPRHGVGMQKRQKNNDTWYSHKLTDPKTGEILFCRGYPGMSSEGWQVPPDPDIFDTNGEIAGGAVGSGVAAKGTPGASAPAEMTHQDPEPPVHQDAVRRVASAVGQPAKNGGPKASKLTQGMTDLGMYKFQDGSEIPGTAAQWVEGYFAAHVGNPTPTEFWAWVRSQKQTSS